MSEVSWKKNWLLFPPCTSKNRQSAASYPNAFQSCTANKAVLPVTESQRTHRHPSWTCGRAQTGDKLKPDFQFSTSLSEMSLQTHVSLLFFQLIKPVRYQKPFTSLHCGICTWKQSAPLHQAGRDWGPSLKCLPEKESLSAHLDWRDWSFSQCKQPLLRCLPVSENIKI